MGVPGWAGVQGLHWRRADWSSAAAGGRSPLAHADGVAGAARELPRPELGGAMKLTAFICLLLGMMPAGRSDPAAAAPPVDARLDAAVSMELVRVPLSDLCWVVGQQTGIH